MVRVFVMFVLLLGLAAGNARAEDAGMACFVKGSPKVAGPTGEWMPLRLFRRLQVGDRVRCDSASEAIVVIFGRGERFRVEPGTTAGVGKLALSGAVSLGGLKGPSEHAARILTGSSVGARASRHPARGVDLTRPYSDYPGWLQDGVRKVQWNPVALAGRYTFSIYDSNDVLLWSVQTMEPEATVPASIPLALKTPYVWRLNAFLPNGLPMRDGEYRWGVLTLLRAGEADELRMLEKELAPQIKANPTDPLPRLLLAQRYRDMGVMTRAWEVIEDASEAQALTDAERGQALLELLNEISGTAQWYGGLHAAAQAAPTDSGVKKP